MSPFPVTIEKENKINMRHIAIVGGGAAGMMAAIAASRNGNTVEIFEKNEKLGKKIYITGKGRCNVTNDADMETVMRHVVTNGKFLYSAFGSFTNEDVKRLLEQAGCPLKTERGNRVFPVSDKASDVIAALARLLKREGVAVHLRTPVKAILTEDKNRQEHTALAPEMERRCAGVLLEDGRTIKADAVIVATGGLSYPSTGSTGDGYRFAKEAGLAVTACSPALVPFTVQESWAASLQGLSLKNVDVLIQNGKKVLYREFGEMLFTHYGVSGPAVLSGSSVVMKQLKKQGTLTMTIDLKPALTEKQLDARIVRDFQAASNKQFKNSLGGLYPSKLIPVMVSLSGIPPEKKVNEISRQERERLAALTKKMQLTINGIRDYNEAIITQGGVAVKEIWPATMEAKRMPGLYFAGEVLDLDALTGGYNLQIAWSTGYAAGRAAGEVCGESARK